jgi:hypothetical protein
MRIGEKKEVKFDYWQRKIRRRRRRKNNNSCMSILIINDMFV